MRTSNSGEMTNEILKKIQETFEYDPETGIVSHMRLGKDYTRTDIKGYVDIVITIGKLAYHTSAHRIGWFLHTGTWLDGSLDHKDRDKSNNRIENLRPASKSENGANALSRRDGWFKGVFTSGEKYRAQIVYMGRSIHIGTFEDQESAARAYNRKAVELFGEFACLNEIAA